MAENKVKSFVKKHKVAICVVGGTVLAAGLTYLGVKIAPQIKLNSLSCSTTTIPTEPLELPYKEIWSNLSDEALTPTQLGNIVLCSPQTINKRLIKYGLQERLPCGDYLRTDLGKKFGTDTIKTTKNGFTFSNIEWNPKVLDIICSQEEFERADEIRKRVSEVMSA